MIGQHQYGERHEVTHMCPMTHDHTAGRACLVCLVMPTKPMEPTFVSTERLARWQQEQDAIIARGGV